MAKSPKTKAGIRTLPLLPVLEHALREHRKEQLALGLASRDHLVFSSASGKPLDRHNVRSKGSVVAAEQAGLHREGSPTVTTHDLRRTFNPHLIVRLGLDPYGLARSLATRK